MTEDIHEGDSLQEAHEIFASVCTNCPAKGGALITGNLRNCTLTIFFSIVRY